ncbi:MAG: CYTH domain-containing protein [Bacteroidales bacterium]|nr:CYTH domain-containing protein [Bacteroidales bacterium]
MAKETERKFLVTGSYKTLSYNQLYIKQGYISSLSERIVRVRTKGDKGYITIKGKPNESGLTRFEWEKEIPVEEAEDLFQLCEPGIIEKIRYEIKVGKHKYEVDEFFGENQGLTVAEIELNSETEDFIRPEWLGEEVTGDSRYYNSNLIKLPYKKW